MREVHKSLAVVVFQPGPSFCAPRLLWLTTTLKKSDGTPISWSEVFVRNVTQKWPKEKNAWKWFSLALSKLLISFPQEHLGREEIVFFKCSSFLDSRRKIIRCVVKTAFYLSRRIFRASRKFRSWPSQKWQISGENNVRTEGLIFSFT